MDKVVFIVDDSDTNLSVAEAVLEEHYNVWTMPSGKRMLALLERVRPGVILLDIDMPEMDGFDVLKALKEDSRYRDIPVIFLTAMLDAKVETMGFELGAVDFVSKPFSPPILLNRVKLHVDMGAVVRENAALIKSAHANIVFVLADIVENRSNGSTSNHVERTGRFITLLVKAMQERGVYPDELGGLDAAMMGEASLLHDIGKINVSDVILDKPGRLTADEFEIIKIHTVAGERIIDKVIERTGESGFLRDAKLFAAYHHERWDGNGYPFGLSGTDIPIQGRLMAIADVYDALISKRPYKDPIPHAQAVDIIMSEKSRHFDPLIVDVFYDIRDQLLDNSSR